ncbi:MAG: phenylalanine--tRNA ligase subunit alpha [Proteobacteria bacterium]|nr:phenylalanine--tRNA ligase subunit alpha [Pseudomonadota bacterium]
MSSNVEAFETRLSQLEQKAAGEIESIKNINLLEEFRLEFFGKKGALTGLMKDLGQLSNEERPKAGQRANQLREKLFQLLDTKKQILTESEWTDRLKNERIDVSLPAPNPLQNYEHPVLRVQEELVRIFERCGFVVEMGPDVESEFHNFDALNIPPLHPSRSMQDTFFVDENSTVMRTHTSPVQARTMLRKQPPIRMICPGRVYRSDYDPTHSPMFHQIEGLLVDTDVHMGDLKGILEHMVSEFFGGALKVRLRPSFFPFTEPSAEVDMECCFCRGRGCRTCKGSGWIEIGGCGMVDPQVFKAVNYNVDQVRGFAFGMGLERMTMLKYGINDLRSFFEADFRYFAQFPRFLL